MFDKLLSAFSSVTKSIGEKELNEKDIDDVLFELEITLLEADVAIEVIDTIKDGLKKDLVGTKVEKSKIGETIKSSLVASISSLFDEAGQINLLERINKKKVMGEPFLILFVGINGTGKTTSLAKMVHMLQRAKYSVVVAASDTFRAGAIEQLREHTKRLNVKLVAQNYNSDPAAVARDAVLYAKSHRTDCVLIDTAGRMQTSKNLMQQIAKITKVVNPDIKIFVGDSLAGNDTVNQAREFFEHVEFDASILTKADADARGGAALSIVKVTSTPILYVGVGQEYQDLKQFDKQIFLDIVFGGDNVTKTWMESAPTMDTVESAVPESKEQIRETEIPAEPASDVPVEPVLDDMTESRVSRVAETRPPEPARAEQRPSQPTPPPDRREGTKQQMPDDPFHGIDDADIAVYSERFDIPPPSNDAEAGALAEKIRAWVRGGRQEKIVGESVDAAETAEEVEADVSIEDVTDMDAAETAEEVGARVEGVAAVDAAETAEEVGARVEGVAAVDAAETAEEVEADVRVEDVTDVDATETAEEVGARVEGVAAVDATETAEEVEADVRVEDVTDVDTDVKEKEPATGPEIPAETASDIHTEPVPDDMTEPRVGNVVETRPPEPEQAEQRPTPPPDNMKEAEQRPSQSTPPPDRRERTKQHLPDDPFHGIDDADIAVYSKQFDIPPPSNDVEAGALAEKIRAWIKDGRQEQAAKAEETIKEAGMSGEGAKEPPRIKTTEAEKSTDEEKGVTARQEREESRPDKDNKPKKKRGLFGLFRKRDKK